MNIGNSYSSWMHNTYRAECGNRSARGSRTGTEETFFAGKNKDDTDVINSAAAGKTDEGEKSEEKKTEEMTYREQILAHMEEMAKKVKEGKVEPTFQTGAQSFTIKEWEKLLADFDDAEEALQEQIRELIAEVEKQAAKEALRREAEGRPDSDGSEKAVTNVSVPEAAQSTAEAGDSVVNPAKSEESGAPAATTAAAGNVGLGKDNGIDDEVTDPEEVAALLTDEVTKCSYPTDDPKNKHWFITAYGQDGIMCREAYMENGKWVNKDCWSLSYTGPGQYERVMAFIQRFPQDANLRFASHEEFWKDFLAGKIDEDDFVNFFETSTNKEGVPDYTCEKDGSTYIDREKVKYAKYMNDFGAHFYTAEEMDLLWRGIIHENRRGLQKISDYDGQMTVPEDVKHGDAQDEEDDLDTEIITKPDGSTVLQIKTSFGVMEVEIAEAQKFGLQYNARLENKVGRVMSESPFVHTAATDLSATKTS